MSVIPHGLIQLGASVFPYLALAFSVLFTWRIWRQVDPSFRWAGWLSMMWGGADLGLLLLLPRLGLSFGPVGLALFFMGAARIALTLLAILPLRIILRRGGEPSRPGLRNTHFLWIALNLVMVAVSIDGLYIEPFWLQTTYQTLPGPASIRIVHLSDIHVERITHREREMLQAVADLHPDLILLTGDYVNIDYREDPLTWQDTRVVLAQLHAPLGVYAVAGTSGVDTPASLENVFQGLNITLLRDQTQRIALPGGEFYLVGVDVTYLAQAQGTLIHLMGGRPPDAYAILLHHTPDLFDTAVQTGVNLYLAGHTHGGQVRLPFYGAVVTFSAFGKRFESGLYTSGATTLYVSRGIGMEGLMMPRARLLCPPEIVVIDLIPR